MISAAFGAVLLDLDGCLIDSNDAHARAWSRALDRFGRRVSAARVRPHIGKGGNELLREYLRPAEQHFLAEALGSIETEIFLAGFHSVRPFPGAARAVRAMRSAGLPVVLASSADRRVVLAALSLLGLRRRITGYVCADDVRKAKPFHDVFSVAIARFGLSRSRAVAVGDTPFDIAAAHQIGLPCIALESGGFAARRLRSAEARFEDLASMWRRGRRLFR
jgi:HAD superfamily hydrolase (TIGR01509 family)